MGIDVLTAGWIVGHEQNVTHGVELGRTHPRERAQRGDAAPGSAAQLDRIVGRDDDGAARDGVEPADGDDAAAPLHRSEEHTSELQSLAYLVCRLLLEKKKKKKKERRTTIHVIQCVREVTMCRCKML